MMIDRQQLAEEAAKTEFREEILEKVILLMDMLDSFSIHPFSPELITEFIHPGSYVSGSCFYCSGNMRVKFKRFDGKLY